MLYKVYSYRLHIVRHTYMGISALQSVPEEAESVPSMLSSSIKLHIKFNISTTIIIVI